MMMLIQRICMALSGFGSPIIVESVMRLRAAMLLWRRGQRELEQVHTPRVRRERERVTDVLS